MDYTILIAEDEPKLREVLCDYFISRGDTPVAVADGLQALQAAQGSIWVHAFCDRGQAHFRIANDCTPLSQEQLDRIWDSFYRADDARSGDGTGLGLAIAKNIITLHGGSCSAEKTKTGVEFRFQIPC